MRTGTAAPKWILTDHLGSTSVVTAFDGTTPVYQRYKPFGETRLESTLGTKYTFTGQLSHTDDFGLLFFNARWVDPQLARFAQADSIVPNPGFPLSWDRYAYTRNNPVRYVDPSGNREEGPCGAGDTCLANILSDSEDVGAGFVAAPWRLDPGYDETTDSIPNWGDPTGRDYESRTDRATRVWGWLCQSGGWWGVGCPSAFDLITWLVWQEIGILLNDLIYYPEFPNIVPININADLGLRVSITYMRDLLIDGIDPGVDLMYFTAFFNPNSRSTFDSMDWMELITEPIPAALNTVSYYWDSPNTYPGKHIVWRTPDEVNGPGYSTHLFDVVHPRTGVIILEFGIR